MLLQCAVMEHVLQVDVASVSLILGAIVPFLVGLVTKKWASSGVKAAANVVLSVAAGVLACIVQANGAVTLGQVTTAAFEALTASGVLYVSVYKPMGLTQKVQNLAPGVGLGKPVVPEPPLSSPSAITQATTAAPSPTVPTTLAEAQALADASISIDGPGYLAWIVPATKDPK